MCDLGFVQRKLALKPVTLCADRPLFSPSLLKKKTEGAPRKKIMASKTIFRVLAAAVAKVQKQSVDHINIASHHGRLYDSHCIRNCISVSQVICATNGAGFNFPVDVFLLG